MNTHNTVFMENLLKVSFNIICSSDYMITDKVGICKKLIVPHFSQKKRYGAYLMIIEG